MTQKNVTVLLFGISIGFIVALMIGKPARYLGWLVFLLLAFYFLGSDIQRFLSSAKSTNTSDKVSRPYLKLEPGTYIVTAQTLNIRLAPNNSGATDGTLSAATEVEVYETKGHYARITEFFDGSEYSESGNIAKWIGSDFLQLKKQKESSPTTLEVDQSTDTATDNVKDDRN
jgi:hypothetical protein